MTDLADPSPLPPPCRRTTVDRARRACRRRVSNRSCRARSRSGSPASRSCPICHRSRAPADRWCTGRSSCCSSDPAPDRTPAALEHAVDAAIDEYRSSPTSHCSASTPTRPPRSSASAARSPPTTSRWKTRPRSARSGSSCKLEAPVGDLTLRGIIDRLELNDDGELIVTDYKTGRAPSPNWERKSLSGLNFYAFLCESLFGKRPAAIRLMYLELERDDHRHADRTVDEVPDAPAPTPSGRPSPTACERDDFRPRQGPLCNYCSYQQWCPEFGGDPQLARVEAPASRSVAS